MIPFLDTISRNANDGCYFGQTWENINCIERLMRWTVRLITHVICCSKLIRIESVREKCLRKSWDQVKKGLLSPKECGYISLSFVTDLEDVPTEKLSPIEKECQQIWLSKQSEFQGDSESIVDRATVGTIVNAIHICKKLECANIDNLVRSILNSPALSSSSDLLKQSRAFLMRVKFNRNKLSKLDQKDLLVFKKLGFIQNN